jgi:hypothetical protein
LLLVVIREFVWPTGQPAWSSTLSEDRLRLLCSVSMRLTFSLLEHRIGDLPACRRKTDYPA